ncbi:hypothetical protein [Pseudoxanthomonas sp. SE1]|uniref:hypothetical protein n=1 Tax=Pseudoxanthomonas sp. SE1 TaxID=1664560 RepID=UPI0031BA96D6
MVRRGDRSTRRTAITQPELAALLATCDATLTGVHERALLLSAFASGGHRRGELAAADMSDLCRFGERAFTLRARSTLDVTSRSIVLASHPRKAHVSP